MSLDAIIDKKRVHAQTKVLCKSEDVPLESVLADHLSDPGIAKPFQFQIQARSNPPVTVRGSAKVCCNLHTAMPKGAFTLQIEDMTEMLKETSDSNEDVMLLEKVTGVVVRISKQVDIEGERLLYRLGEVELATK